MHSTRAVRHSTFEERFELMSVSPSENVKPEIKPVRAESPLFDWSDVDVLI